MKMTLDFNTIIPAIRGTAKILEDNGRLRLCRFTDAQTEAYKNYSSDFYKKTKATAGVRLEFSTDSTSLTLKGEVVSSSSRKFYGFDVYADGSLVSHVRGAVEAEYVDYTVTADLGVNKAKKITVYFPWSAQANITSLELDDGASFEPVTRPYKMICFGDSITHGYDALNPSFSYASRLADALRADHINKGIGGEVFFPTLAELKDSIEPDYITVAYGTNDWSKTQKDVFEKNSKLFYEALSKNYPNAKIFALAPVWRKNYTLTTKPIGEFSNVAKKLSEIAESLPNVTFIDCFDFIPHEEQYYIADVLHPNDAGFYHYAAEVYRAIKGYHIIAKGDKQWQILL